MDCRQFSTPLLNPVGKAALAVSALVTGPGAALVLVTVVLPVAAALSTFVPFGVGRRTITAATIAPMTRRPPAAARYLSIFASDVGGVGEVVALRVKERCVGWEGECVPGPVPMPGTVSCGLV